MDVSIEELFQESQTRRFGVSQRLVNELNHEGVRSDHLSALALCCTDAILANDQASLEIISTGPDIQATITDEHEATYVALADIAQVTLMQRELNPALKEIREDRELLADTFLRITEDPGATDLNLLNSLLVDALRGDDAESLRVLSRMSSRAHHPLLTPSSAFYRRGVYTAIKLVADIGLQRQLPQLDDHEISELALLHEQAACLGETDESHTDNSEEKSETRRNLARYHLILIRQIGNTSIIDLTPKGRAALKRLGYISDSPESS
jgi:hypothetical protein